MVGIVIPDEECAFSWASKHGFNKDLAELSKNDKFKDAIMADMTHLAKENGLKSFEQVKLVRVNLDYILYIVLILNFFHA